MMGERFGKNVKKETEVRKLEQKLKELKDRRMARMTEKRHQDEINQLKEEGFIIKLIAEKEDEARLRREEDIKLERIKIGLEGGALL